METSHIAHQIQKQAANLQNTKKEKMKCDRKRDLVCTCANHAINPFNAQPYSHHPQPTAWSSPTQKHEN